MALLTDEPRSATVRADTAGRVLRLARDRFLEMLRREPAAFLAVTTTLSRRLAARNAAQIESEQHLGAALERALHDLSPDRRAAVLDACVLDELSDDALRALFGAAADRVRADLSTIGIRADGPTRAGLRSLRHRTQGSEGAAAFDARRARGPERLIAGRHWDDALAVAAREAGHSQVAALLGQALRAVPPIEPESAHRWAAQLGDDDALRDTDVALARAGGLAARGDHAAASAMLRRALGVALVSGDEPGALRLSERLARLSEGAAAEHGRVAPAGRAAGAQTRPAWRAVGFVAATVVLVLVAALPGAARPWSFVALLGAAIVL